MSDEKLTVKIPVELLASVSKPAQEAKTTDKAFVTLQFTREWASKFGSLRAELSALQELQVANSHAGVDRAIKTSELRISFYEKLILLAGGSFALSLTFLGYVHRNAQATPLLAMGRFKTAWILLLVTIIFSWLHNLSRCAVVEHAVAASSAFITSVHNNSISDLFVRLAAMLKVAESPATGFSDGISDAAESIKQDGKKSLSDGSERVERFKRLYYVSSALGGIAVLSIVAAFILMIAFAIKNAALL
jgi:hypothetical protein